MTEMLKSLELKGTMKSSKISRIFTLIYPEIKRKIHSKLYKFKTTNDFFNYYTKKDINSYLNELNDINIKLSNICDDYYLSNSSFTDKKITIISKIIVILKLIINIQDIINTQIISIEKYLLNIFNNKEFTIEQNIYKNLKNLIENVTNLKNSSNLRQSMSHQKLSRNYSSTHDFSIINVSHNSFFHNFDLNTLTKNTVYESNDNQNTGEQTPSFEKEDSMIKNLESLNIKHIYKKENEEIQKKISEDVIVQKGSQLSLTDSIFVVEKSKKNLIEMKKKIGRDKKNPLLDRKQKNKFENSTYFLEISKKKAKSHNDEHKCLSPGNDRIKIYGYLLEIIKKSYNSCYINAEEKSRLKQLIISKPRLIEETYIIFLKSGNNDKSKIVDYLKNYL